jgi:hypothetical protein
LKDMLEVGLGLRPDDFVTFEQKSAVIPKFGRSYRHIAQKLGTEWGRELVHPDLWLNLSREDIQGEMSRGWSVAVTDVRFENEAKLIRSMGGTVVHIKRPAGPALEGEAAAHVSEVAVSVGPLDRVITNVGTVADLHAAVESVYQTCLEVA